MLELSAYAKINLGLEVTGRRSDGYHGIVSILQLIDLHDTIILAPAEGVTLASDDPLMLAEGENNLVLRAARLLRETSGTSQGAHITLHKCIPASAGLGGGSSDAAATLAGLSQLWELDLPCEELMRLGAMLGSDVPFFQGGPTALVEGRGEVVTQVASPPPFWVVLVCPNYDLPNKTRQLYASLAPRDMSDGSATRALIGQMAGGADLTSLPLRNAFERPAFTIFSGLDKVRTTMLDGGAPTVHLSGSGPTLYTLYTHKAHAEAQNLHARLTSLGLRSYLAGSVTSDE